MSDRVAETAAALAQACADAAIPISLAGYVREADVSRLLGICLRTARGWRYEGRGPTPTRIGGRFWYSLESLATFLSTQEETGNERQEPARSDMVFPAETADDEIVEQQFQRNTR